MFRYKPVTKRIDPRGSLRVRRIRGSTASRGWSGWRVRPKRPPWRGCSTGRTRRAPRTSSSSLFFSFSGKFLALKCEKYPELINHRNVVSIFSNYVRIACYGRIYGVFSANFARWWWIAGYTDDVYARGFHQNLMKLRCRFFSLVNKS